MGGAQGERRQALGRGRSQAQRSGTTNARQPTSLVARDAQNVNHAWADGAGQRSPCGKGTAVSHKVKHLPVATPRDQHDRARPRRVAAGRSHRPAGGTARRRSEPVLASLDLDGGAGLFELGLGGFSASSLLAFSSTALGAASTRSLASFRPRLVSSRTTLMTWIFWAPAAVRMTSNSSFSSSAGAAAARHRRPAAATATGAAAVTPNFSSNASSSSLSSSTVSWRWRRGSLPS